MGSAVTLARQMQAQARIRRLRDRLDMERVMAGIRRALEEIQRRG